MTDVPKIDFWACGADRGSNVAHAYIAGKALCGSPQYPSRQHWESPGNLACKPCWKAHMARTGIPCPECLGKGRHCVRRYPGRRYAPCKDCAGVGYICRPKSQIPTTPTLPFLPGQTVRYRNHVTGKDLGTLVILESTFEFVTAQKSEGALVFTFTPDGNATWSSNLSISHP